VETLIVWIVSFMVMLAPPGRPSYIPEATESKVEATARYESIAQDITSVVWNPIEKPLFRGRSGRSRTTALILSIMLNESGFRKDVDIGVGKHARGDGGNSWCLMQMNLGTGKTRPWNQKKYRFAKPPCKSLCAEGQPAGADCQKLPADQRYCDPPEDITDGVTGRELVEDRKKCIREGFHALHGVLCTSLPTREWLRGYASGSCDKGSDESHRRMDLAISWYGNNKPSFKDDDIMNPPEVAPVVPPQMLPNAFVLTRPIYNLAINDALIPRFQVR